MVFFQLSLELFLYTGGILFFEYTITIAGKFIHIIAEKL